jgi:hypothetical protein
MREYRALDRRVLLLGLETPHEPKRNGLLFMGGRGKSYPNLVIGSDLTLI